MAHRTHVASSLIASIVLAASAVAAPPAQAPKQAQLPKAFNAVPGPDAEVLSLVDRYSLAADGAVVHEHSQRIQVNSSLAINRLLGESRIVWDPAIESFEVLHNRTVLPSGTVVPGPANAVVDEQPPAVHGNPLWSGLRRRVIVHTALEPGAVIEASWRVRRTAVQPAGITVAESITGEFPVKERIVEVEAPNDSSLRVWATGAFARPPAECVEREGRRTCRIRVADVAARPQEAGAPPRVAVDDFVLAVAGADAVPGYAGRELQRLVEAAGAAPAGAVALARKAADAEPDRERRLLAALTALTDAVNVSADLRPSQTGWRLRPLADVWKAGWATPLEMAALEAGVLGELGFVAQPVLMLSGPMALAASAGFALHDRPAILVRDDAEHEEGRLYDPREPAADRPLEYAAGKAHLVVPANQATLASLGMPVPWRRSLVANLTVDDKGAVKGELALATDGAATPHALLVRDALKVANRLAAGLLDGGKASNVRVTALGRQSAALAASFEGSLPEANALGLVALKLVGVAGGVTDELPPLPGTQRLTPVGLPGPGEETVEVRLTLPKGWTVASPLAPVKVDNPLGSVEVSSSQGDGGTVTVRRTISFRDQAAPAADAAKVREILAAWGSPASRDLLLRPPAK
jgi:hypothetical protein